jgi:hypothetical protein
VCVCLFVRFVLCVFVFVFASVRTSPSVDLCVCVCVCVDKSVLLLSLTQQDLSPRNGGSPLRLRTPEVR